VSNELWPEMKHQIITEKIEGWVQTDWKPECKWLLPNGKVSWNPPNYSSSLDLVARAEAKVAEMGLEGEYMQCLQEVMGIYVCFVYDLEPKPAFTFFTAPATARVNALVSLAQMGVFDGK
jgi:hypothetical protein